MDASLIPRPFSPTDARRDREEKARLTERNEAALRGTGATNGTRIVETRTGLEQALAEAGVRYQQALDAEAAARAAVDEKLDAARGEIDAAAAERDTRLAEAEAGLTAADGRLDTAEGQLTDAFGQLGTVDSRIGTAKAGAISTAASDAQSKADMAKAAAISAAAADAQTKADAARNAAQAQINQIIARGTSLVRNGDFEAPDGWAVGSYSSTNAAIEAGNARSGTKALRIGPNPGGNVWPTSEWVPGSTNRTYYLEMWVKKLTAAQVDANGIGFVLQTKTAAGGTGTFTLGRVSSDTIPTASFTKVSATFKATTADAVAVRFAPWCLASNNVYSIDDFLVVDVTEAQAALDAAAAADAKAATAQTAAGDARTQADAALTMATSKSTVYYSSSVATGTGKAAGDLWRQRNAGKEIIAEWQWTGTAWERQTVSGSNVSNMDVGYLTAGAATMSQALIDKLVAGTAAFQQADIKNLFVTDVAAMDTAVAQAIYTRKLAAGRILADEVLIGSGANLFPDPLLQDKAGWSNQAFYNATGGRTTGGSIVIPQGTTQQGTYYGQAANLTNRRVQLVAGGTYRISGWVKTSAAAPAGSLQVYLRYQAPGSTTGAIATNVATQAPVNAVATVAGAWTFVSGMVTIPATTTYLTGVLGVFTQAAYTGGTATWSDLAIQSAADASLQVDGTVLARALESELVLASKIIAGIKDGTRAEMSPAGFKVFAVPAGGGPATEVVRMGVAATDDFLAVVRADATLAATISSDGVISAKSLYTDEDIYYHGNELQTLLDKASRGLQAYGVIAQDIGFGTSEYGMFDVKFEADATRAYRVHVKTTAYTSTANGIKWRIRSDVNTARPSITSYLQKDHEQPGSTTQWLSEAWSFVSYPGYKTSGTWTERYLLTGQKMVDGTATFKSGEVTIEDIGPRIWASAGINNGGGTVAASPIEYKKTYQANNSSSYQGSGAVYGFDTGHMYQGLSPAGYGSLSSLATFPDMTGDLSGATISRVRAYFYYDHWYYNSGGTALIGVHGFTTLPSTFSHSGVALSSGEWPKPGGRWVDIPSNYWAGFKSGAYRGLSLTGDGTYGTYGYAQRPILEFTYSK